MSNSRFNDFYSKFSTEVLIEKLESHRNGSQKLGDDWYNGLKEHLYTRELTEAQKDFIGTDQLLNSVKVNQQMPHETRRYPALRTIAGVFAALAWIIGLAIVLVAGYFLLTGSQGIFEALLMIIGGVLTFIMLIAASELIKLFIDIEYNTRQSAKKD